jgi:hypothetical protein
MQLSEIRAYVKDLAEQDLSITDAQVDRWVNTAIDRINTALESNIPRIASGAATTYEPEFDSRYHEVLVIFANAKYRESDADFNSAGYFMNTFNDMLMDMQRDMEIPPAFRKDKDVQQIVVTNATTMVYDLSMPYGSYFDYIQVYRNNVPLNTINYRITLNTKQITLQGLTLTVGDKITVVFENDSALNQPPHAWWTNW